MSENKKSIQLPENISVDYAFEKMIKSFLKKIQKDGIIQEVIKRRYYSKPSTLKRAKKKEIERKHKK